MERRVYEAAVEASVESLRKLLQEDALLLDRSMVSCYSETPLHIASMLGHEKFVQAILNRKPELAEELDSRRSSALHLATAKGYRGIVLELVSAKPEMCYACDRDGKNPLHVAALKGHDEVLKELVKVRPEACRILMDRGETILHACIRYNQLNCLKLLVETLNDHEFVNSKDDDGNTILHLAVIDKQVETTNYLLMNTRVEVNALNAHGYTALDVLAQSRRDIKDLDIADSLREAGAFKTIEIQSSLNRNSTGIGRSVRNNRAVSNSIVPDEQLEALPQEGLINLQQKNNKGDWLTRKRDALMVVASLIATMAFQAGVNPPGGVWQDDFPGPGDGSQENSTTEAHQAGTAIIAYKYSTRYAMYLAFNTAGFLSSLSIILLLITGLPYKQRFFMWVLTVTVWIAITSMALAYTISIHAFTPKKDERTVTRVVEYGVKSWSTVMFLLLVGHTIRLLAIFSKRFGRLIGKRRRPSPL